MSRLIDGHAYNEEENLEGSLRPKFLKDFTGQDSVCENLRIFIQAAKQRGDTLDHILLAGPPGLGKTTLAHIVANELGVDFRITSAPILAKAGDLAALLTNLHPNSVFFIDEIHRLNPAVEEMLYSALEDFKIDIMIGEGRTAKSLRLDLAPFTLIGATTRVGLLTQPLRERFGIPLQLQFYDPKDLSLIIKRAASILKTPITEEGSYEIAKRSRGTPRVANRLLRRVRDFAYVLSKDAPSQEPTSPELTKDQRQIKDPRITEEISKQALKKLGVDEAGLDEQDLKYLRILAYNYNGGPAGIETLSAALAEEKDTIEDTIEPFLLQRGFIGRTPRGRILTPQAYQHLNLPEPRKEEDARCLL